MSDKYVINKSTLEGIGNAIRNKKGTSDLIPVSDLASEIASIPSGITPTGQIEITENGTFDVTSFASALVAVEGGGGDLPEWIEVGEFTPQQNLATYTISHNKGREPQCAVYLADELHSTTAYLAKIGFGFRYGDGGLGSGCAFNNNTGTMSSFSTAYAGIDSMDTENVVIKSRNATYQFKIGYTYKYIIIFKDEE